MLKSHYSPDFTALYNFINPNPSDNFELIKTLLKKNPSLLQQKDRQGNTPVIWVASEGHERLLKLMIEIDSTVLQHKDSDRGPTAAIYAAVHGLTDALKLMIKVDPSVLQQADEDTRATPIIWAVEGDHNDTLELIVETDSTTLQQRDSNGNSAAHVAAKKGNCKVLELMIKTNSDVMKQSNNDGMTPPLLAAKHGHSAALEFMIEKDPSMLHQSNNDGVSLPFLAASFGHEHVLIRLIKKYPEVLKQKTDFGVSLAFPVALNGLGAGMKLILESEPSLLEQANSLGSTPIQLLGETLKHTQAKINEIVAKNSTSSRIPIFILRIRQLLTTCNVIYAYRRPDNATSLCETLFGKDADKDAKDKEIPAILDIQSKVKKAIILLNNRTSLEKPSETKFDENEFSKLRDSIFEELDKLNVSCANLFPEFYNDYYYLTSLYACRNQDWDTAFKAVDNISKDNKNYQQELAQIFLATASSKLPKGAPDSEVFYQRARTCFVNANKLQDYYRIRYGCSCIQNSADFLKQYRQLFNGYLDVNAKTKSHSEQTQIRTSKIANEKNRALFFKFFQRINVLLEAYVAETEPVIPLEIVAHVVDKLEELCEKIQANQSKEAKIATLTYFSLKSMIGKLKQEFIEPYLEQQKITTLELSSEIHKFN